MHQRDGHLNGRYANCAASDSNDYHHLGNVITRNLRRAFPLPRRDHSVAGRFAALLNALSRMSEEVL